MNPTTPHTQPLPGITCAWFSLIRFRSPLLTESLLFSLPVGTEMFHFPTFPPHRLYIQRRVTPHDWCWVSPFGNPRITARLTTPRGISQPPTSFIGSRCQGIHRAPLDTYNTQTHTKPGNNRKPSQTDAPFMTSSAKNTTKCLHRNINDRNKTTPPDTNDLASWLMLASTIRFSNNTHHHTATHPHPERPWYVSADAQQQQKGRVLSDTQQCADETPPTGQAGQQAIRITVSVFHPII